MRQDEILSGKYEYQKQKVVKTGLNYPCHKKKYNYEL